MNDRWRSLTHRERWIVGSGAALLLVLLIYALLWRPQQQRLHALRQTVTAQQAEIGWMRQAAAEVERLSLAPIERSTLVQDRRSLLTRVDSSATEAGLAEAVKRVEPQDTDRMQVQLEQVGFDALIRWLTELQQQHGIVIDNAAVERQSASGRVNARLILRQGRSS